MNKKIDKIIEEFNDNFKPLDVKKGFIFGEGELPIGFSKEINYVYIKDFKDFLKQKLTEFQDDIVGSIPVEKALEGYNKERFEIQKTLLETMGYSHKEEYNCLRVRLTQIDRNIERLLSYKTY